MLKAASAVLTAATIAAVVTIVSAPANGPVSAGPLPQKEEAVLKSCTRAPWPYNTCVGTAIGNPKIRLVTTDKLARE